MATSSATILIADISGFTEFMTTTELNHGSFAINIFMDAMIKTLGEDYEVSEIEGDAILVIRKGAPPTKKEIQQTCINIFHAFHFQRKWMQQHAICPCGACLAIEQLTLKFIVHHGPVAEMKVGRFVKQSGPEMIVAHRLLKNSIDNNEYLLMTERLFGQTDPAEIGSAADLEWRGASEEYDSIGKINYHFALLKDARNKIPEPTPIEEYSITGHSIETETHINANYRDVYMVVMNIPGRPEWIPDLLAVEQDMPGVFIGSVHRCTFKQYEAVISPRHMTSIPELITYAESCAIKSAGIQVIYAFEFRKAGDHCLLTCRLAGDKGVEIPADLNDMLLSGMREMTEKLKERCEQMEVSFFDTFFQKN